MYRHQESPHAKPQKDEVLRGNFSRSFCLVSSVTRRVHFAPHAPSNSPPPSAGVSSSAARTPYKKGSAGALVRAHESFTKQPPCNAPAPAKRKETARTGGGIISERTRDVLPCLPWGDKRCFIARGLPLPPLLYRTFKPPTR